MTRPNLLATAAQVARRAVSEAWLVLSDPSQAVLSDRERLKRAEETIETLRSEWRAFKHESQAEIEALSDLAQTVERKRARIAARESAEKRKNGTGEAETVDPLSPTSLRQAAIAAGALSPGGE